MLYDPACTPGPLVHTLILSTLGHATDGWRCAAKQLEKVLEDGDAALDTIEQDSDRKEKQLLKQGASVGGTGKASKKADTNKLLKQLLS